MGCEQGWNHNKNVEVSVSARFDFCGCLFGTVCCLLEQNALLATREMAKRVYREKRYHVGCLEVLISRRSVPFSVASATRPGGHGYHSN